MILGMTKTKRIFPVSLTKPNKKTMKGGVACDGPALFKWQANSCYLDSLLIGWLHFADADFLDHLNFLDRAQPDGNKKNLIRKLIEVYNSLKRYGPPADPTLIREEFRSVLQKCVDITILMPRPSFEDTQDPADIYSLITNYLDINDIILNNKYIGFRGYTEDQINNLMEENPGRNRRQINTFNPDVPEPPERPDDIRNTNIISLKPSLGLIKPSDLINMQLESRRNNIGDDKYIVEQKITGTVHGILPIGVYRGNYGDSRDKTDIVMESHVELDDGTYQLVSVICYVPGHYVAYYKCNEGDDWIFYNDIGISQRGGGSCEEDIRGIFEKNISENNFGTLKYDGIMELDFIKAVKFSEADKKQLYNIIQKYEKLSNEFMNKLIEKIVDYICNRHLSFKATSHTIHSWYEKNKKIIRVQLKNIIKSNICSKFKGNSTVKEKITEAIRTVENKRIQQIKSLRETLRIYYTDSFKNKPSSTSPSPFPSPSSSRSPSPPRRLPALPTRAVSASSASALRAEAPIYLPIGPLDTWYDKNIPGYPQKEIKQRGKIIGYENSTPRNSATLLFYKKMDQ